MGYSENKIYEIIPTDSYRVIRSCAKCGTKSSFVNTNSFRINANGNKLDVWLIYQCNKCKHSYNLTIYERISRTELKKEEYEKLLANDALLALEYGNRRELFAKNRAEIDYENVSYQINKITAACESTSAVLEIRNPYGVRIRSDKILSEILQLPRNKIKQMIKDGRMSAIPGFLTEKIEVGFLQKI